MILKLRFLRQRLVRWLTARTVASLLLIMGVLGGVLGYLNQYSGLCIPLMPVRLIADFYANISTELISIALTVLVIDALNERRSIEREKKALILQMSSPTNLVAIEAVRVLRVRGWLTDGSLRGADLSHADLQGAYLAGVDMANAKLFRTNLKGAHLQFANLNGVEEVTDAQLAQARYLRRAIMPDGSRYDGRYNLVGDVQWARNEYKIEVNDHEAMASTYLGIPLERYLEGQVWARQNLARVRREKHAVQEGELLNGNDPLSTKKSNG